MTMETCIWGTLKDVLDRRTPVTLAGLRGEMEPACAVTLGDNLVSAAQVQTLLMVTAFRYRYTWRIAIVIVFSFLQTCVRVWSTLVFLEKHTPSPRSRVSLGRCRKGGPEGIHLLKVTQPVRGGVGLGTPLLPRTLEVPALAPDPALAPHQLPCLLLPSPPRLGGQLTLWRDSS